MKYYFAMLAIGLAACSGPKSVVRPGTPGPPPSPALAPPAPLAAAAVSGTPSSHDSVSALLVQADQAWAQRSERQSLEQAITLWEQAQVQAPNDPLIATSLSRAYYFLGDGPLRFAAETDAMLDTFEKGVLAGERAMMGQSPEFAARVKAGDKIEDAVHLIPNTAQSALYWYASNLGKFSMTKGFTTMLFYRERVFAIMERALAIDEKYFYAAPHRYLGAFYAKAPSFAGGDLTKAKQHFDKALELSPEFFGTKVLYAELYAVRADDKALFSKLLKDVTTADPGKLAESAPEQRIEQEKARRLLAQTDELF